MAGAAAAGGGLAANATAILREQTAATEGQSLKREPAESQQRRWRVLTALTPHCCWRAA